VQVLEHPVGHGGLLPGRMVVACGVSMFRDVPLILALGSWRSPQSVDRADRMSLLHPAVFLTVPFQTKWLGIWRTWALSCSSRWCSAYTLC
jgi:hypothetical protein